ncbi:MAG: 2-dehydropantoate 2-reductase [Thermoanaerobaculia bacterium]|nr:2-dehydropantoate 2-reductase [Thermoanaerobaculia bacterium]
MKIAMVGVGGVGGYFGAKLAQSGADVTFVARGATAGALRSNGIRVESIAGNFSVPHIRVRDERSPGEEFDAVLIAVKAWQLPDAIASIRLLLGRDTLVVPLLNGVEAPELLSRELGQEHVAGGLSAIVAWAAAPGVIRHAGADPTIMFGELDNRRSDRCESLLGILRSAGITAELPPDIQRSMWTKFAFITPMSGIGGVTRVPVGIWRTTPETRAMAIAAVKEVAAVAAARGIALDADLIPLTMSRYDGLPPDATASLQRDVMSGRPSELEAQLGAVVRLGAESGVVTQLHAFMYHALLPGERLVRKNG